MPDLRYEAPGTLADAVKALAASEGPSRILAGGTDVIVQLEMDPPPHPAWNSPNPPN